MAEFDTSEIDIDTAVADALGTYARSADGDDIWLIIVGVMVFFMHAGFAMLEAGSVRKTSVTNIMFKNVGTVSIGAIMYFFTGWAFAYGTITYTPFLGTSQFGNYKNEDKSLWFFQMVFAATAATIVSGAVAGRIQLMAYFAFTIFLTGWVYPIVSHWIWATGGWISAFTAPEDRPNDFGCGMLDYAGSGVVHMTGGVAAFWGALILKPRVGWTPEGIPPHNQALTTLGTFILWFGWYGFNCGSTLVFDGPNAGHVALTTTLSPSAACILGFTLYKALFKTWNLSSALNCILAGLVSITAGCSIMTPGFAVLTGMIGAVVYLASSKLMKLVGIDDPVDAIAVHGFCGMWGVMAVAFFANPDLVNNAYSTVPDCLRTTNFGERLFFQAAGLASILGWVSVHAAVAFFALSYTGKLRLSDDEQADVDGSEHGAKAYEG